MSYLFLSCTEKNINDSYGLEIILGGFSNNQNNLLILSSSGNLINEINITDKIRAGFAVADINDNSFDDVAFGTYNNKLYLVLDNQTIAPGFPFEASDKFTVKPTIINYLGDKGGDWLCSKGESIAANMACNALLDSIDIGWIPDVDSLCSDKYLILLIRG